MSARRPPSAHFDGRLATDLVEVADLTADASPLDGGGWWALVATFEGRVTGYRFLRVTTAPLPPPEPGTGWSGPSPAEWRSSLDRTGFVARVHRVREAIAAGQVYQVNVCRMLRAPVRAADPWALAARLADGNPAPYAGVVDVGDDWVVTASPELFLERDGDLVRSAPIKGTARPGEPFADKDFPENIMITDLVRNDLGRVARPGTVTVTGLLERQEHPGLAHLVSTVQARLRAGVGWNDLLAATFPPGSVTGAPKIRARQLISELEQVPRGPYCGAVGYVDADAGRARLAVGIRTFVGASAGESGGGSMVSFGTGAGITYASDAEDEWAETELKAAHLIALASG